MLYLEIVETVPSEVVQVGSGIRLGDRRVGVRTPLY